MVAGRRERAVIFFLAVGENRPAINGWQYVGLPFRRSFHYAISLRRAKRWARRFLRRWPLGEVAIYRRERRFPR
jgi:hypothetical protein